MTSSYEIDSRNGQISCFGLDKFDIIVDLKQHVAFIHVVVLKFNNFRLYYCYIK